MAVGRLSSATRLPDVNQNPITNLISATGGTETTYTSSGKTYRVHTFTGSGTLTVLNPGFIDILLQGAGGGGSSETGGENGTTMQINTFYVSGGSYTITVGAGGTTVPTGGSPPFNGGNPGSNSTFASIVARGGTGGGFSRSPGNPANPGALTSSINGTSTAYPNATYGNGGSTAPANGAAGVVIVAYEINPAPLTQSPAIVSSHTGTYSTYTGDGTNGIAGRIYDVYTFTGSGSIAVTVGAGGAGGVSHGDAGFSALGNILRAGGGQGGWQLNSRRNGLGGGLS